MTAVTFAQLSLICLVALLGPILSQRRWLPVPVVVGELAVGLVLGAGGFNVLSARDPSFTLLADIGFALVMLVAGSHVPVRDPALRTGMRLGALRAVAIGVVAVAGAMAISSVFGHGNAALYAVLLASSSASLIMPALSPASMATTPVIQMLPQIALADAACIVAVPLVIDPAHLGRAALGAALVLLASALAYLLLALAVNGGYQQRVHRVSEVHGLAVELRASLVVLFALAALATTMHVSIMLAGFAMGLALSAVGEPRRLTKQLFALTEGFFGPVFFVWLGSSIDLRDLGEHPAAIALGLALGLGAVAVHVLVGVATKQPWPVAALTAAQVGVPVAAAAAGTQLGVLAAGESTALLLGAIVTIGVAAGVSGKINRPARPAPG